MKRFKFKNLLVIFILFFASISNSFSAGGEVDPLKLIGASKVLLVSLIELRYKEDFKFIKKFVHLAIQCNI